MKSNQIYKKSQAGHSEIEASQHELSKMQRRVLILVNGKNDEAALSKMSLCEDISETLEFLRARKLVEPIKTQQTGAAETQQTGAAETQQTDTAMPLAEAKQNGDTDIGTREFLCNTLLTYGNRVRVAKLIEEINTVENVDQLKQLVNTWYRAIAESPAGMYDADNLKKRALKLLTLEEASGLR